MRKTRRKKQKTRRKKRKGGANVSSSQTTTRRGTSSTRGTSPRPTSPSRSRSQTTTPGTPILHGTRGLVYSSDITTSRCSSKMLLNYNNYSTMAEFPKTQAGIKKLVGETRKQIKKCSNYPPPDNPFIDNLMTHIVNFAKYELERQDLKKDADANPFTLQDIKNNFDRTRPPIFRFAKHCPIHSRECTHVLPNDSRIKKISELKTLYNELKSFMSLGSV